MHAPAGEHVTDPCAGCVKLVSVSVPPWYSWSFASTSPKPCTSADIVSSFAIGMGASTLTCTEVVAVWPASSVTVSVIVPEFAVLKNVGEKVGPVHVPIGEFQS